MVAVRYFWGATGDRRMTLETSDVSKVANKKTTNEQEIAARKGELDSRDNLVSS